MGAVSAEPLVVTISAAYGAGGSAVGPLVAEELGVPFVDRAIAKAVAAQLAIPEDDAAARDDSGPTALDRLLRALAAVGPMTGVDLSGDFGSLSFAEATEQVIRRYADTSGGVILGRAGAVVLADRPGALHVRLTGPKRRRAEQAMRIVGIDRRTAEERLAHNDAAREGYVRSFYGVDATDPALYHAVLDSTAIPLDECVAFIVRAARALQASAPAHV
jgi:cytidylate kinase